MIKFVTIVAPKCSRFMPYLCPSSKAITYNRLLHHQPFQFANLNHNIRCLSNSEYINAAKSTALFESFSIHPISKRWYSEKVEPSVSESDEQEKRRQQQVRMTKYTLIGLGVIGVSLIGYFLSEWGPPRKDLWGRPIEDEFSKYPLIKQYVLRCWDTMTNYNEALKEPARELLLPGPLQSPYIQPPYTLVIESNGVLTHPDWTYKTGWRWKKRPFVEYLLQQCAPPLFEIVIFTTDSGPTAYPILDALDPSGCIMYKLFRDSTRYENGVRIKDLNCLNRDLSRVIHIDWDDKACQLNPRNCLTLKKWEGKDGDKSLFDLAQFLRAIASQEVEDVREVISHYQQFDDPLEAFKEKQRRLLLEEEQASDITSKVPSYLSAFKRK